jgi:hypothetical protein
MTDHILYINIDFDSEVTLDLMMSEAIDMLSQITWRRLLSEILYEDLETEYLETLLEDYGIEAHQLDTPLDGNSQEKYYDKITFFLDNAAGPEAKAFDFLRELNLFPMDIDGNGGAEGVSLVQTTANGPKKYVFIEGESAAAWLASEFIARGLAVELKFV